MGEGSFEFSQHLIADTFFKNGFTFSIILLAISKSFQLILVHSEICQVERKKFQKCEIALRLKNAAFNKFIVLLLGLVVV